MISGYHKTCVLIFIYKVLTESKLAPRNLQKFYLLHSKKEHVVPKSCISIGIDIRNSDRNTLVKKIFDHIYRNQDIHIFRGVNLLSVSTVYILIIYILIKLYLIGVDRH